MKSSDHATEPGDLLVAKDLVFPSQRLGNLSVSYSKHVEYVKHDTWFTASLVQGNLFELQWHVQ